MQGSLVTIYMNMMTELQAEEALAQVEILQIGGGLQDRSAMHRTLSAWRRAAGYHAPAASPSALELMGVGVQAVKKK